MIFETMLTLAAIDASLSPSGKWTVDHRSDSCIASRPFGAEPASVYLAFQPILSPDMHKMRLSVLTPDDKGAGTGSGEAKVTLQPSGAVATVEYNAKLVNIGGLRGYEMIVDTDKLPQIGQSTQVSIDTGRRSFSFSTGKLQPVLDATAACNSDLMRSWGVDPTALAEPIGNPGSWFSYDRYPAAALKKHVSGRVIIALTVNNEGRLKACRIAATSGDPDLDDGTCKVAKSTARFAAKAGGDRYSVFTVRWWIDD